MILFETAYQKDFEYYERVFDTNLNKSVERKITTPFEWFEESSNGDYISITDNSKRFVRKQGTSKQARNQNGVFNPIQRQIRDNYWGKAYNKEARIFYCDIESRVGTASKGFPKPELALEPISLMQIFDSTSKTMFIFGDRPWKFQAQYTFEYPVKYIQCSDEINIIEGFLNLFKQLNPLIVYAWNGAGFDFPYIFNRMKNLGMDTQRLSNYGKVSLKSKPVGFKTYYSIETQGHYFLDLLEIYKKFTFGQKSSYSLDNIAFEELGERKVPHTEYAAFDDFYTGKYIHPQNPTEEQKKSNIFKASTAYIETNDEKYLTLVKELSHSEFVYYGGKDTHLITRVDQKKNFTTLMVMMAEKMGVLIEDTMGTVKPWSNFIANTGYTNKEIIPAKDRESVEVSVKGGRVTDPVVGKHDWVVSVDVNSLYPSEMRAFNMSPEKFVPRHELPKDLLELVLRYFNDEDEDARLMLDNSILNKASELLTKYNMSLGMNGAVFKADSKGMVPKLIEDIYTDRKKAKGTQLKYEQRKILIKEILKSKQTPN